MKSICFSTWCTGRGPKETTVNEIRKETVDRLAMYQTDYVRKTCIYILLVPQTAAAASKMLLLCFSFPVLSFRSWCSVWVGVLFYFVWHLRGSHDTSFLFSVYQVYLFIHLCMHAFIHALIHSFIQTVRWWCSGFSAFSFRSGCIHSAIQPFSHLFSYLLLSARTYFIVRVLSACVICIYSISKFLCFYSFNIFS